MNASERKRPLIAISDDDTTILFMLASELEAEGYEVISFEDKRKLLKRLSLIMPDVVITDIVDPRLNGFEFIRQVKENPLTKHIPIIAISGSVEVPRKREMYKLGACDFVPKPFKLSRILNSLRRVLKQSPGPSGKAGDN